MLGAEADFGVVFLIARRQWEERMNVFVCWFQPCVVSDGSLQERLGGAGFCPKCGGGGTEKRFLDGCIPATNISSMCQTSLSKFEHADVDFSQKTEKKQIFLCF